MTNGIITTIAGNGNPNFSGDGGPATSTLLASPAGVAVDKNGTVYIADQTNNRVRKISALYSTANILYTLKSGNWNDATVWSCGRVPVNPDTVVINHTIVMPSNYTDQALQLVYSTSGKIQFGDSSQLKMAGN